MVDFAGTQDIKPRRSDKGEQLRCAETEYCGRGQRRTVREKLRFLCLLWMDDRSLQLLEISWKRSASKQQMHPVVRNWNKQQ